MRYPNLRYGNATALRYFAMGSTPAELARRLRRDERTVRDWLSERSKIPWWVPEILRLQALESDNMMRQHTQHLATPAQFRRPLATVTHAAQLELRRPPDAKKPQPMTALRLDDFDGPALTSCAS